MNQSLDNPFSRIAATVELAELALVIVAGPDHRAEEGLRLIRTHLSPERETLWHRLDRDGPDIASTLHRATTLQPIVLVHGLERFPEAHRIETEVRLNLLRDTLAATRGAIILWVPESSLESFRTHCPDLYHWRSLLVMLSEQDVPVDLELEARRRYAAMLLRQIRFRSDELYVEPQVLPMGATEPQPLSGWLSGVKYGYLTGGPGAGKSLALQAFAVKLAREATEDPRDAVLPFLIHSVDIVGVLQRLPDASLDELVFDKLLFVIWEDTKYLEQWALEGRLVLLVDALEEVLHRSLSSDGEKLIHWLTRLQSRYPGLKIQIAGRRDSDLHGPNWQRARLLPFDETLIREFLERVFLEADPSPIPTARTYSLFSAARYYCDLLQPLSSTPLLLSTLCRLLRQYVRPLLTFMWGQLMEVLLEKWDRGKRTFRGGSLTRADLHRVLQWLALELLVRKQSVFGVEKLEEIVSQVDNRAPLIVQEVLFVSLERACIVQAEEPGRYRFIHPRVQAFLAAEALVQDEKTALEQLSRHIDEPSWHDLFLFALEMAWHSYGLDKGAFLDVLWPLGEGMGMQLSPDVRLRRAALILEAAARDVAVEQQIDAELLEKWQGRDLQLPDSLIESASPQAYSALAAASGMLGSFRVAPP